MDRQQGSTLQHRELNQYTMINLYHDFEQNTMILFIPDFRYTMTYTSYTKYILFHILCYILFQQNTRFSIYYDKPLSQYIEYVPCAIQQNLVYPFYMQQFASAYSKLPILPSFTSLPLATTTLFSISVSTLLFHRHTNLCHILDFTCMISYGVSPSLPDLLHLA